MYCPNCKSIVLNGIRTCPNCGAAINGYATNETVNTNGFAAQQNANPYNQNATPYNQPVYQQPNPYAAQVPDAGSGYALAVLILGILSFFGGGIITAIISLCLASKYNRIGSGANADKVKVGKVCSWITVGFTIAAILLFIIYVIFMVAYGTSVVPYY